MDIGGRAMQFQLITPEKIFFSGDIIEVSIPGEAGEFGVLEGHAAMISTLKPGVVTIQTSDGTTHRIGITGGVADALPERCSVLAEVALSLDDLSTEQLKASLTEAQATFNRVSDEFEIQAASQHLAMLEAAVAA